MTEKKLLKRKEKALLEDNKNLLISACIDLAEMYYGREDFAKAIREYKLIAEVYKAQDKMLDYARTVRMIGEAYNLLDKFTEAVEYLNIYCKVAKEQRDGVEQQRAFATLGLAYMTKYLTLVDSPDRNLLELALQAYKKSLQICEGLTGIGKLEQMDMKARLYANMGLVEECKGDYDKGIELIKMSIVICKSNDLYEQLERGHSTLASIYTKKKQYRDAIHHYNVAMEVAGRLENKIPLKCASLLNKADILVKLADFHGAKRVLHKAFKMKSTNQSDRNSIENNLKIVAALCKTEDSLLLASETDYKLRRDLYEKMGDGTALLKNYSQAIEYYKKMLDCVNMLGDNHKDLSACYISLGQTYSDNEDYDLAIEYFQKDYNLNRDNFKEALTTMYSIIDVIEKSGKSVDIANQIFAKARTDCKKNGDRHAEGKTVSRQLAFLGKFRRTDLVKKLEKELTELGYESSDDGSDVMEGDNSITQNIGDDVDLDDITDESVCSDAEVEPGNTRKTRTKTFAIKRNMKGETQLHTACVAGNVALANKLLNQGHAVNVRDHCGWLPIHEACLYGHLEIVRMLVSKGAWINDRGGVHCGGMTPLHDACCNGHLDVAEYLLDNGASGITKTNKGETALYMIREWRNSAEPLDPIQQTHYETVLARLVSILEKVGQSHVETVSSDFGEDAVVYVPDEPVATERRVQKRASRSNKENRKIGNLRRNLEYLDDEDSSDSQSSNASFTEAAENYKSVMDSLRHKDNDDNKKRKFGEVSNRSALLTISDVGDDWLEDDLSVNKKQKSSANVPIITTTSIKSNKENFNSVINRIEDVYLEEATSSQVIQCKNYKPPVAQKKKKQSTLTKAGFTKRKSDSPKKVKIMEADSQSQLLPVDLPMSQVRKMLHVDVRIAEQLFRIPVPALEMETLTFKWLADEVTNRYFKKEGINATVELVTKTNACLFPEDNVSMLFPTDGSSCETIQANITKSSIPTISERYAELCLAINETIMKALQFDSGVLRVTDENLRDQLLPLCKALNHQSALVELDLSGNMMGDECGELLCQSLESLDSLAILNLSRNHLTVQTLKMMAGNHAKNLQSLDLSHNPLGDESFKYLEKIAHASQLRALLLSDANFTSNIFRFHESVDLRLGNVERFDISHNLLCDETLMKFVSCLKPANLRHLDVGHNAVSGSTFGPKFCEYLKQNASLDKLEVMNLADCKMSDSDMYDLLRLLISARNLQTLNLSFNNITIVSLKRILEHCPLQHLDVSFCDHLSDNIAMYSEQWKFNAALSKKCRTLQTSLHPENDETVYNVLVGLWETEYGKNVDIDGKEIGMLRFSTQ